MTTRYTGAGPAQDPSDVPERAALTWTRAQLAEQIQHTGAALDAIAGPASSPPRETDRPPLADMEAEP
jgi:hypothetical protein